MTLISDLLNKPAEHLVMNQSDNYRQTQEQRYLIDRTIPTVDYGKGCKCNWVCVGEGCGRVRGCGGGI